MRHYVPWSIFTGTAGTNIVEIAREYPNQSLEIVAMDGNSVDLAADRCKCEFIATIGKPS